MLAAMAATAYADVTLSGDARVRGTWKMNYDTNDAVDQDERFYDQRVRVKLDAKVSGVTLKTRLHLFGGGNYRWDGASNDNSVVTDYAYLVVPVGKSVTVTAGRQKASFGMGLFIKDATKDRLKIALKGGANTKLIFFADKAVETDNDSYNNLDDKDAYGAIIKTKLGGWTTNAVLVYVANNIGGGGSFASSAGKSGAQGSVFLNGKVQDVSVTLEAAMKAKEISGWSGATDTAHAGLLILSKGLTPKLSAAFGAGYTKNGYRADDNLAPTNFFGTATQTGMMNFGATGDTIALVPWVTYKLTNNLSVLGRYASASTREAALTEASRRST
jgi:hypothetical protein